MTQVIKVAIADDHQMMRDGLEALIKTTQDIEVVGSARDGQVLLNLLKNTPVDIALLDIEMPTMDGLITTRVIKDHFPQIKILILTMYNNEAYIKEVMEAGASGYILKNKGSNELIQAIRAVYTGKEYLGDAVKDTLVQSSLGKKTTSVLNKLTNREKDVLRLIGQGMTTKEMSKQLGIKDSTIETHRMNLKDKLGVRDSKQLMIYARDNGYVD
ncbi:hypothetical protein BKI52_15905 [marine bacterium AO1-C]|nr:hypothetical protein BKI52_15905 [marine bacterium AO1-C]